MRHIILITSVISFVNSCGTLQTITQSGQRKLYYSSNYKDNKCKNIPRIYSGAVINSCIMFLGPRSNYVEAYIHSMDMFF